MSKRDDHGGGFFVTQAAWDDLVDWSAPSRTDRLRAEGVAYHIDDRRALRDELDRERAKLLAAGYVELPLARLSYYEPHLGYDGRGGAVEVLKAVAVVEALTPHDIYVLPPVDFAAAHALVTSALPPEHARLVHGALRRAADCLLGLGKGER